MPPKAYHAVAPLYDELMQHVNYDVWFKHYMAVLSISRIPIYRVLELGCGTGIMTQRFSEYFPVTAVDASIPMLEEAQKKRYARDVEFIHADIGEMALGETFPAAVAVFDVLNCVSDDEQLLQWLERIAMHLDRGARFVFDLNTPYAFKAQLFDEFIEDPDNDYRHHWRGAYDEKTQRIEVHMEFQKGDWKFEELHKQRAHSLAEVKDALKKAGFVRAIFYDANTMGPVKKHSDRYLVAATKA